MAIVLQNDMGGLGRGIENFGSALGQALQARGQQSQYRKGADILQQQLASLGENPSPMDVQSAFQKAISQGAPPELVQNMAKQYTNLQKSQPKSPLNITKPGELSSILQQFGVDQETADKYDALYPKLTTGGQTAFANIVFDQIQRAGANGGFSQPQQSFGMGQNPDQGSALGNVLGPAQGGQAPSQQPQVQEESVTEEFEYPAVNPFVGLKPSERVARQNQLYNDNAKLFAESNAKLRTKKSEERSIKQLNAINDSGKLPSGFGKAINVDWKNGDLRIPSAANKETQLFVKTINEFVRKARDSFGARVTNFELDKFLQGLPTLANTEEGRRLILTQMEAMNNIDKIYEQNLKDVYNKYGLYNIDRQQAEQIAERKAAPEVEQWVDRFFEAPRAQEIYEMQQNTPDGHVFVKFGEDFGYVPEEELEVAIQQGAKRR